MIKKLLIALFIVSSLQGPSYAQTGATAPIFGLDQCLWIETEDGTVVNNYCGKIIVPNGSLTDNGDGTFTLAVSAPQESEQVIFAGEDVIFGGENVFYP
ncbi:MAG: hypothetical protein HC880_00500 [Bacteroidia bacterium]|nr:hypothetical protein [Bacteroidia bacterium]